MKSLFFILMISVTCGAFGKNLSLVHKASFDETYERYPSPFAVIQQFKHILPYPRNYDGQCLTLNSASAPVTGAIDPLQGAALEKEPGSLFYQFYQDCVRELVKKGFVSPNDGGETAVTNSYYILGSELSQKLRADLAASCSPENHKMNITCYDDPQVNFANLWGAVPNKFISDSLREEIFRRFILYLVGPDALLKELGYLGDNTVFHRPLKTRDELAQYILSLIPEHDEAPLATLYAEFAILLRLGPALKS